MTDDALRAASGFSEADRVDAFSWFRPRHTLASPLIVCAEVV